MVRGRASGGWWEPPCLRAPQGSRVLSEPRPRQPSVCELQDRKRDLHRDSPAWWRQAVPGALGGACAWKGVCVCGGGEPPLVLVMGRRPHPAAGLLES